MGRAPCCDKANVKKGPWSTEEDAKLKEYIQKYGTGGNWIALPQKAGLKRCGKSCRLRWLNYLRPNIKHGDFTEAEDAIICSLFAKIGSRWSIIAAQLPGRTDNDIKNYWNTKLKKKIMGIPTSQRKMQLEKHQEKTLPSSFENLIVPATTLISSRFSPQKTLLPYPESFISEDSLFQVLSGELYQERENNSSPVFGSSRKLNHGRTIEDELGPDVLLHEGVREDQQKFLGTGSRVEREIGLWGEAPLDYTLEEIKQLITTGSACSGLFLGDQTCAMDGTSNARGRELMSYN